MDQHPAPSTTELWTGRITAIVTQLMSAISRHWLAVANLTLALFVGLPLLAPALMQAGHEHWGEVIHSLFYVTCHQLPERSYFLYGPSMLYSRGELVMLAGEAVSLRFAGNGLVGYKMAVCQRCTAIYAAWLMWGLLFGLVRKRLAPLSVRRAILLLVPMAIDGLGQLVGLWQSTWLTRSITGVLFGLAVVWLAYPYLETGMRDMHNEAQRMSAKERS